MSATLKRLLTSIASASLLFGLLSVAPAAATGEAQTYLVVYSGSAVPSDAAAKVKSAGGSIVARYDKIGVLVARSDSLTFGTTMKADNRVAGATATAGYGTQLTDDQGTSADASAIDPGVPAPGSDSLSSLQWDMDQIHAPEARAINGGSSSIVVGDIDTGLDYTHPDLAPNVDFTKSVSCLGGIADTAPSAWMDQNGHGTHTAGTIAAAKNGIGIVGVAPKVKIAGIRAGDANGFFFPEAVICAFMWAGDKKIPVTNNSYFADPWLFNCRNDAGQRAIWTAERRALSYAQGKGTLVIAAEGNQADDLAHPTQDATSPDDTTPVLRDIHNQCAVFPTEAPGVVGVTANGNLKLKSFYSSYGVGSATVVAPGGDSILQLTAAAPNGRVLSTWPASLLTITCLPSRRVVDVSGATYCYQQGTSMAAPHVAGVAALIASTGVKSPGAIRGMLGGTADPIACPPDTSIYAFFPAIDNGAPQVCTGGVGYNSFNGQGQVNALSALGH